MNEGPRILLLSDDGDVAQPLLAALRRAGYRAGPAAEEENIEEIGFSPPDVLIVDRDIPAGARRQVGKGLARHSGRLAFPLIVLGGPSGNEGEFVPEDWHEDAIMILPRQSQPGEVVTATRALLRLAFYRTYRELVHDLSQPVTVLHALSDRLAHDVPPDAPHHDRVMRLRDEVERMLSLMERFQRARALKDR